MSRILVQQIFPTVLSFLAVSCVEFLHALDLHESHVVAESRYVHRRETRGLALYIHGFERLLALRVLHPSFGFKARYRSSLHEHTNPAGVKR